MENHLAIKDVAHRLVEELEDGATWEDLMYKIYVRQSIEAGLKDMKEGKVQSLDEVRRGYGLAQ